MRFSGFKSVVLSCIEEYFDTTAVAIVQYLMEVAFGTLNDLVTAVRLPPDIIKTSMMALLRHNIAFFVELPVLRNGHELSRKHMVYGVFSEQAMVRMFCPIVLPRVSDFDGLGDQLLAALTLGGSMTAPEILEVLRTMNVDVALPRLLETLSTLLSRGVIQRSSELRERCQNLITSAYYAHHHQSHNPKGSESGEPPRKHSYGLHSLEPDNISDSGESYCVSVEQLIALFQEEELADYVCTVYDRDMGTVFRAALFISNSFQALGFCPFSPADVRPNTRSFNLEQLHGALINTQYSLNATGSNFTLSFCASVLNLYVSEPKAMVHMTSDGQYIVDIDTAIERMQMAVLLRIVAERHGPMARRMFNIIRARGMMEASVVAAEGMIPRSQAVSLLTTLCTEGYLQITMLSNSAEPKVETSYFLYSINPNFSSVAANAAFTCLHNMRSKLKQIEELQFTLLASNQVQRINDQIDLIEPIYIKLIETAMLLF
ncbi:Hypothetical protein GLP15_3091 [Giardia lamblia P15]|uniref:DNA-directed RNA polymerase III subunit RPC3 n=1 Tax=Giardia intestinalis (strain P15) TaxID=658858 RepID=E1F2U0_GIAIA|nr:Hypothetical protein GLP15_3091 [Giardia lamblia P15]